MKSIIILIALVVALSISAFGQNEYEYGKPDDLQGLTKIYLDTKGDLKDRNKMIEEISKANIGLVVVDSKEDAEIFVDFNTTESSQAVARTITNTYDPKYSVNVVSKVKIVTGDAMVTIKGKTTEKQRVVMNFHGGRSNPASAFVKQFIKVYKTANGIK